MQIHIFVNKEIEAKQIFFPLNITMQFYFEYFSYYTMYALKFSMNA